MRRTACVITLFAVALPLAACGDEDGPDPRAAVEQFAAATKKKDYQTLCDKILATALVDELRSAGLPCEVALKTGLGDVKKPTLVIEKIEENDDAALARVRTGAANQEPATVQLKLVKEKDAWKVASLAGTGPEPPQPKGP